ncbi:hypothetical protein ABC974_05275 [Sphingomonas oligophenolica]|uniref:Uncharacterized protein n=2 Tax=Sphingomonas oligophenolica TaxID=301154 RepID=A0ABU9XZN7_9SPHN
MAATLIMLQSALRASVEEAKPYSPRVTHTTCSSQGDAGSDIVVCGHVDADERYRLEPLTHQYDPVGAPASARTSAPGRPIFTRPARRAPTASPTSASW